jgi:hypothetical protein
MQIKINNNINNFNSVEQQRDELLGLLYDKSLWNFLSDFEKEKVEKIKNHANQKTKNHTLH